MDILIKNIGGLPEDDDLTLTITPKGEIILGGCIFTHNFGKEVKAVALPEHGRLISAEDFIDSFEEIINECRRQLSEKGEDITVLNYFHDTIVELIGYMPTVLEATE